MIVKKMKNKMPGKSITFTVMNLVDYINDEKNLEEDEKITYKSTINMEAETSEEIAAEMIELATKSKRCKNPVSHILLSFGGKFEAEKEQFENIVKDFAENIGYAGCQIAFAVHDNTQNTHIHIAVNRIDPETHKARDDYNDVDKMHRAIARLEAKYNLKSEAKSLYTEVEGEIVKNQYAGPETEITIPAKAREMEIRQGEKSMTRVAAEEIIPIIKDAKSWPELHDRLAAQGFRYEKKGGGAVLIAKREDGGEAQLKPSSLARWAALKQLEKRLGEYAPSRIGEGDIMPRKAEPMPGVPQKVFDEYQADKKQYKDNHEAEYREFERQKEALKVEQKAIIEAIKDYKTAEKTGSEAEAALEAYRRVVDAETEGQHRALIARYEAKIAEGKTIMPPVTDFETWLKWKGKEGEYTDGGTNKVEIPSYEEAKPDHTTQQKRAFFIQYHNAIGADKYRITSVGTKKDGTKIVLVLDKDKDGISNGYTAKQILDNIQYMNVLEAKGEHLYFTPLSEKKHHFFIDDMNLETLSELKKANIQPNCIIESSKGNYQAIFSLDKIGTENERMIINNIASSMNRLYGDVNFCGAVHPHRAPGYYNVKPKHKQPDGSYFITRIVETNPQQCKKLLDYMVYMDGYFTWKKRNTDRPTISVEKRKQIHNNNEAKMIFEAHRKEIMRINNFGGEEDKSRIDYMIAVRLKATGHTQDEIQNILYIGNIGEARSKTNLEQYAATTAASVFSKPEADMMIQRLKAWIPSWKRLENTTLKPDCSLEEARKKREEERQRIIKAEEERRRYEQREQQRQQLVARAMQQNMQGQGSKPNTGGSVPRM